MVLQVIGISTVGRENLQILPIFDKLITHLHVYNIHLEKSALDNSMAQQPATKELQFLLISGEIILNLSNELEEKKNREFS